MHSETVTFAFGAATWRTQRNIFGLFAPLYDKRLELSPRALRDRRSLSVEILAYCCIRITQTDRVSAWGALSVTATLYSATIIVLYTHRYTRHNIAQPACNFVRVINRLPYNLVDVNWTVTVINHTSTTTSVVDDTAYYSASVTQWTRFTVMDGYKWRFKTAIKTRWPAKVTGKF